MMLKLVIWTVFILNNYGASSVERTWCNDQTPRSQGCTCLLAQTGDSTVARKWPEGVESIMTLSNCMGTTPPELIDQSQVKVFLNEMVKKFRSKGPGMSENCVQVSFVLAEIEALTKWLLNKEVPSAVAMLIMYTVQHRQLAHTCQLQHGESSFARASRHLDMLHDENGSLESWTQQQNSSEDIVNSTTGLIMEEFQTEVNHSISLVENSAAVLLPVDFVSDVFRMAGDREVMTMGQFNALLEDLGIGGSDSETIAAVEVYDRTVPGSVDGFQNLNSTSRVQNVTGSDDVVFNRSRSKRHTDVEKLNAPVIDQCLSSSSILRIHDISESSRIISKEDFIQLCPALIQQQLAATCTYDAQLEAIIVHERSDMHIYGYSTLCVLIISVCSIMGVVLLPCLSASHQVYIMSLCLALAVGALCGDALFHLLPASYGLKVHFQQQDNNGSEPLYRLDPQVYRGLAVLGAMYMFYLIESLIAITRAGTCSSEEEEEQDRASHYRVRNPETVNQLDLVSHSPRSITNVDLDFSELNTNTQPAVHRDSDERIWYYEDERRCASRASRGFNTSLAQFQLDLSHLSAPPPSTIISQPSVGSPALLVIITDMLHNIADGLAVGAAFSLSMPIGFSTSLAVLFHEIPHELADFAVMLQAGMHFRMALLCNVASTLISFIGLYVGLSIAVIPLVRVWLYTFISGMFLYLALACLVPALTQMQKDVTSKRKLALVIFLQNAGFLLAVGIYLILAMFEHHIGKVFEYLV